MIGLGPLSFLTPLAAPVALVGILPLVAFVAVSRQARRLRSSLQLVEPGRMRYTTAVAVVAVALLVGLAAAQPVLARDRNERVRADAEVIFVLDISRSMLASGSTGATRLDRAKAAWTDMIAKAKAKGVKVALLTPTGDTSAKLDDANDPLNQHAAQVRELAAAHHVALVDSLAAFQAYVKSGGKIGDVMSQGNHPNRRGHDLVANELMKWFPASPKPLQLQHPGIKPCRLPDG